MTIRQIPDREEERRLRKVLRRIDKEQYLKWVLTKSRTIVSEGKIVSLDLSWLGISHLPENFLDGLDYLRNLRFDNNPSCEYSPNCFSGVPNLVDIKFQFCFLKEFPSHAFGEDNNIQMLYLRNNPLQELKANDFSNFTALQSLNLSECYLRSIDSSSFSGMKSLLSLQLQNNYLEEIPGFVFSSQVNLKQLDIQNNRVHGIDSSSFAGLRSLDQLILDNNQISHLSEEILCHLINLKRLSLYNNLLNDITPIFTTLPRLESVNLDFNFIQYLKKEMFHESRNLEYLRLNYNQIEHIERGTFDDLPNLSIVKLSHNPLSLDAAVMLPDIVHFDYTPLVMKTDSESLHWAILKHPHNLSFLKAAMYSGKLLEKTWAFIKLIGVNP